MGDSNGSRERSITAWIGKLVLTVPGHRYETFHGTLWDNCQRNEQARITTMMEMVVEGVSTGKVGKVTEELCGPKFSKSNVSDLCKNLDKAVNISKSRDSERDYPFLMVDASYLKAREEHRVCSKALLVSIGINPHRMKEVLDFPIYGEGTEQHWEIFFRNLKMRGLKGVDLVASHNHFGLVAAIHKVFQNIAWQRGQFHFSRNILDRVPKKYQVGLEVELPEMFNASTFEAATQRKNEIMDDYADITLKAMRC